MCALPCRRDRTKALSASHSTFMISGSWILLLVLAAASSSSVLGFVPSSISCGGRTTAFWRQRQFAGQRIDVTLLEGTPFKVRERLKRNFRKLTQGRTNDIITDASSSHVSSDDNEKEETSTALTSSLSEQPAVEGTLNGSVKSTSTSASASVTMETTAESEGSTPSPNIMPGTSTAVLEKPAAEKQATILSKEEEEEATLTLADKVVDTNSTQSILTPDLPLPEVDLIQIRKLYTLPPVDRDLSKLETEFREMLEFFSQFTEADLYTIRDARVRTIFEGVIASSNEPAVYRAFEVLFEDLVPLRIAGRMIYSKLKQIMEDAQSRGQTEVDAIVDTTGLPSERVQVSRLAFLTLAVATEHGHDEEAHLPIEQLVDSGLAETAMQLLGYDDINDFIRNVDHNQDEKVTFSELMVGLQIMAEESCAIEKCDPAVVLQAVVNEAMPSLSYPNMELDQKRQEYSKKFDDMVKAFQEWQDVVPTGEGRRLDVLRGCFVGAANTRVVEALRIVYLDYSALRVAGNTIFSLMAALVKQLRKRQKVS